jgi:cation transporter-like permease
MNIYLSILAAVLTAVPICIAAQRKHANIALIAVLSFFFSWTIVGWFVAMAWAIRGKSDPREFSKQSGGL